jgi:alpha-L-fucosidase 2
MRVYTYISVIVLLQLFSCNITGQQSVINPFTSISSWLPATQPENALLQGNGEMAALVYGHPHNETIILSHCDLYLPLSQPLLPINQADKLEEIRKLILEGKGTEAAQIPVDISMDEGYDGQIWSNPYIPAFDLRILTSSGNVEKYTRSVNYETGETFVSWMQNNNHIERKQFISRADSFLVIKIVAQDPVDLTFWFEQRPVAWNQWDYINDNIESTTNYANDISLFYKSEFVHQWEGSLAGFVGEAKLVSFNGDLTTALNEIKLTNTTEAVLVLKIDTYSTNESPNSVFVKNNVNFNYDRLLDSHKRVHTELYNRVKFNLGNTESDLNTDSEVVNLQAKQNVTNDIIVKRFYASRYNILSATGINPPNLQGIWGSSWQPPWSSDYTHDGNLPVAISSFLSSNMPELMMSYFDYHDARRPDYRKNAKKLYGCRGIQVPSHSSTNGYNVHFDPIWCLTFWNGGAAWASHFYYDYWLYTNDTTFLKSRAYPFMKEAALFYEDFLTKGNDGKYIFNPSYSPENNPLNNPSQATVNAAMDVMLANELFQNLIKAGKVVNEDTLLINTWNDILQNLPEYEVNSDGFLKEWLWTDYQDNYDHRHISHLYGLYDIIDQQFNNSEELKKGALKVVKEKLNLRKSEKGGIMVFGLVQLAWVAANLGDEALVEEIINMLSSYYWSDSFATYHDPEGLFNMDLSGGYQTAIIRSLVYSEPGFLDIFPAKPPSWKNGEISGISARKQLNIESLNWSENSVSLELISKIPQKISIRFPMTYNLQEMAIVNGELLGNDINSNIMEIEVPNDKKVVIQLNKKHL